MIVQECGAGLVRVRRTADGLAFAAPPLLREGPVDEIEVEHIASVLRIDRSEILDAAWADNGPGWVAVLLETPTRCWRSSRGSWTSTSASSGRIPRARRRRSSCGRSCPKNGSTDEDPVTGSLNASVAGWLLATGRASAPYVARQGTVLGRAGRIHVSVDGDGAIWVAGGTVTCVDGAVEL